MSLFSSIKDHIMIGGPNAMAGWGLWFLLVAGNGFSRGSFSVNIYPYIPVVIATLLTGNGIYALNAYFDSVNDKVNTFKSNRPIPSGRMSRPHALKYSSALIVAGMVVSIGISVASSNYMFAAFWSVFTVLGIAYSTPPLKLKSRHIFGNLTFGYFAALCIMVGSLVSGSQHGGEVSLASLYSERTLLMTISVAGLITMKDFDDVEGDKAGGDITLPVKFGREWAAAISMVLMFAPIAYGIYTWTPSRGQPVQTLDTILQRNFWDFIWIISFGVYAVINRIWHPVLSDPYARVQYYYIILHVAWGFLLDPLGLNPSRRNPTPLQTLIATWERPVWLGVYIIAQFAVVYMAWRTSRSKHE